MDLNQEDIRCLITLQECGVEFVIIGGHAVNFHGVSRETKDLDILTGNDLEASASLSSAIKHLIGPHPNVTTEAIYNRKRQINLAQHGLPLEFLTAIDGLDFREVLAESEPIIVGDYEFRVISKRHLIHAKQVAGRPIDADDINRLEAG